MGAILGLAVTMCMVFGGYILAGGKMSIILKSLPFEMMMIGGAATGAFVAANDFSTIKHTAGDVGAAAKLHRNIGRRQDCLYRVAIGAGAFKSPVQINHVEVLESRRLELRRLVARIRIVARRLIHFTA